MKSWPEPTPDQVDAAIRRLIHVGQIRYFFDRLENPNWVKPLWERGFFKKPPPTIPGERENTIAFPIWPESKFLARMAKHAPTLVCDIIDRMPPTDNARVLEDFMDATVAMPASVAGNLLPKIKAWGENPYQFFIYEKLGELIASFAKGGESKTAIQLAKRLFAIRLSPSKKIKMPDGSETEVGREPTARVDAWDYEQALKKCLPSLTSAVGIETLEMLGDLTEEAVRPRNSGSKGEDYSTIWRPAIEDHEQNTGHTLKDALIDAVRNTAIEIGSECPQRLEQVVTTLEKRPYPIFSRIALYALSEVEIAEPRLIAERLLDRKLFDSARHRHEYAKLLQTKFPLLDAADQETILKWVENGPDVEEYQERTQQNLGRTATEEEVQRYVNLWKRDRISWFLDSAPQRLRDLYDEIAATEGEPEHADFSSFRTSWVGPISPKTDEELRQYNFDELLDYLRSWKPTNEWQSPSREGLKRVLETLVVERYRKFSEGAEDLKGLPAIYLGGIISGLTSAISKEPTLDWARTFELCTWILTQKDDENLTNEDEENIQAWQSVRQQIASLLEKGFINNSIPYELREQTWELLKPLTKDPDPTPDYETRFGGENSSPWDMAINTVRGVAFHALLQYGLWCLRASKNGADGEATAFNGAPEFIRVLEHHLDPENDPSLAIRSVYGQFFPWIMLIDREWAKANVERIFPTASAEVSFWNAAWGGYILFVQPFDEVLDLIFNQYAFAVEALDATNEGQERDRQTEHLAGHLMTYYWRGKLDGDQEKALFERFWEKAPAETRAAALRFIGLSLRNTKEDLPPDIRERLVALWESRVRVVSEENEEERNPIELREFGSWFVSGAFLNDWALEQLSQVLSLTNTIERERDTLTKLVNVFPDYPHKTAEILKKILYGTEKTWGISLIREGVQELLRRMLTHDDPAIRQVARELIDLLGAKGHLEFRDLLKATSLVSSE